MGARLGRLLGLAGLLFLSVEPVPAQYTRSYSSPLPGWGNFSRMRQHFSTRAANRAITRRAITSARSTPGSGVPSRRVPKPSTSPPPSASGTDFRPQTASVAPAVMAAATSRTAAERAKLEQAYSEMLAVYRERLRASGGPQNDVARAAAFLIATSYGAYHGTGSIPQSHFDVVRGQLAREFASDPAFQRKSDRERQLEFELYAILGTAVVLHDPAKRESLRTLARENLIAALGVPPERIVITDRGVETREAAARR